MYHFIQWINHSFIFLHCKYNKLLYIGGMIKDKYLIVIGGPTAIGKTNSSIGLAQKLQCDIISADSRQFYREMNIGTAKPTASEQSQANHHFIDSLSIHDDYSVGKFERDTLNLLDELFATNDYCILTGGAGLFLNAICYGLDRFPAVSPNYRISLNQELQERGFGVLQKELARADPEYYKKVDEKNPQRVIRALEVIRSSGKPFSSFLKKVPTARPFQILPFQLQMERDRLYGRINRRVDNMIEQGLEQEARALFSHRDLNALRTVGYSEWFAHFGGEIDRNTAIELIKRNTRRYAKRQVTWFRNQGAYQPIQQVDKTVALVLQALKINKEKSS